MRNRKIIAKLNIIFIVAVLFLLPSCSLGKEQFFSTPIQTFPETLDSREVVSDDGKNIILNCYQGLMKTDKDGKIVPACALKYTRTTDFKSYTFYLNDKGKWRLPKDKSKKLAEVLGDDYEKSFNTKVKADDFLFAVERAVEPQNKNPDVSLTYNIKNAKAIHNGKASMNSLGVKIIGDNVITFELEKPDPNFLYKLTTPIFMPTNREFFEKTKGRYGLLPYLTLSNGPYYVDEIVEGKYIKIKKSQTFADYKVKNGGVTFVFDDQPEMYEERLIERKGYLIAKISRGTNVENIPSLKSKAIQNAVKTMIFNPNNNFLKDDNFRKAIYHATDKKIYTENVNSFIPNSVPIGISDKYSSLNYNFSFDKNSASKLYNRSKLKENKISLNLICQKEDEKLAKRIVANWQEVFGINFSVKIETEEEHDILNKAATGDYDIIIMPVYAKQKFADEILMSFHSELKNDIVKLNSLKLNSLIDNMTTQTDLEKKNRACNSIEQYLYDEAILMPLENYKTQIGYRKNVKGLIISRDGSFYLFANAK